MTLLVCPRQAVRLPGRLPKRAPRGTRAPALLRFSPFAWAKLVFFRDAGPTEIGAFGISSPEHPLLVQDVCLVTQRASGMTVCFEDQAVADFFDRQVDLGRSPDQFARIWIHTHPGHSPLPSGTDEATFARSFGGADWSVMFILACGGTTYARLQFSAGPGGDVLLPVEIDFSRPFAAASPELWEAEYCEQVAWGAGHLESPPQPAGALFDSRETVSDPWFEDPHFQPRRPPVSWEALHD